MSVRKRPDLGGNFEAFAKIDAALQRYTKALNAPGGAPCGAVVDCNELWGVGYSKCCAETAQKGVQYRREGHPVRGGRGPVAK